MSFDLSIQLTDGEWEMLQSASRKDGNEETNSIDESINRTGRSHFSFVLKHLNAAIILNDKLI